MKLAIAFTFLASPALALSTVTATTPDDALLVVTLQNGATLHRDETHTFQTDLGPVTVRFVSTTDGPNGCCPDSLQVIDMPNGARAVPDTFIEVDEDTSGSIRIERYIGG